MTFNPNIKLGWQLGPKVSVGGEYYGTTGSIVRLAPSSEQSHVLYPSIDLFLSPDWEFNAGYGMQLSGTGDHDILKVIIGRRIKHWGRRDSWEHYVLAGCRPVLASTSLGERRNGAAFHVLRIQTRHVSGPAASSARGRPATLRASFICP